MEWPTVAIAILTYDRPREIRETIAALFDFICYPADKLVWLVGDDGSPGDYLEKIDQDYKELDITFVTTNRKGWGANANNLLKRAFQKADYVFFTEDDYKALRKVDLCSGVAILESTPEIGMVRYDGVAGHPLTISLCEAKTRMGTLQYGRINKDSPHLNIYSNRPHLFTRAFLQSYGSYAERKTLGATEENYAHRVKGQEGPEVAILPTGWEVGFDHIGVSRQGTKEDPWQKTT